MHPSRSASAFILLLSLTASLGCNRDHPVVAESVDPGRAKAAAMLVAATERFAVPVTDAQPWLGPEDARVTVVLFEDFQPSTNVFGQVERARAHHPDVRLVWRHRRTVGARAGILAREAFVQQGNGGFWKLHRRLQDEQDFTFPDRVLAEHAKAMGLDATRLETHEHDSALDADDALAHALDAWSRDAVFINGRRVKMPSWDESEVLAAILAEEIELADTLLALGVPAADLYATFTKDARPELPEAERDRIYRIDGRVPDPAAVYAVPIEDAIVAGKADALVTIVAFVPLGCLECMPSLGSTFPTPSALRTEHPDDVRIAYMPTLGLLARRNPDTSPRLLAWRAALEAHAQKGVDAFWPLQELLVESSEDTTRSMVSGWAEKLDLDPAALTAAIDSDARDQALIEREKLGASLGVSSPWITYFVNGRRLSMLERPDELNAVIAEQRARANRLIEAGVSPDRLYDTIIANGATAPQFLPDGTCR